MNRLYVLVVLTILARHSLQADTLMGRLEHEDLSEASGMVASTMTAGMYWLLNDSGNDPVLFAIDSTGRHLGCVLVDGVKNNDWEDLAGFHDATGSRLLIGDTGDNRAVRDTVFLYLLAEPDRSVLNVDKPVTTGVEKTIRFVYEDGPRDCESLAVDVTNRQILLLSKRTTPPVLYSLPLDTAGVTLTARRVCKVDQIPGPTPEDIDAYGDNARYLKQPTAMDLLPDGRLVVLTYKDAWLFNTNSDLPSGKRFRVSPREIPLPHLPQQEAICFTTDGSALLMTSEQRPAELWKIELPAK